MLFTTSHKLATLHNTDSGVVIRKLLITGCLRLGFETRLWVYSLMSFFIGNREKFQTNSSVHNINTRNKHHLHRPVTNLSCFQKGVSYSGIRIFNSLPRSITNLKNDKTQFKVALKKFLNTHSFYSVDELFTCTDDM